MKKIFLFIAIAFSVTINAQVTQVSLQASGLTCSMCSNSINKALRTLDFVLKVDADIKTYTFEIFFKPNSNVDFDLIKMKVENAGFSVAGFVATIHFNNIPILNNQTATMESLLKLTIFHRFAYPLESRNKNINNDFNRYRNFLSPSDNITVCHFKNL